VAALSALGLACTFGLTILGGLWGNSGETLAIGLNEGTRPNRADANGSRLTRARRVFPVISAKPL
jgi:hypothetical protein